jgi:imidazolonepropionase-like amidohydrolase
MKKFLILLFSLAVTRGYSQDILIRHINIIDVINGHIQFDRSILISNRKIREISGNAISAKNAMTVNGKGKFIIPGLWDMHVHTVDSSYLKLFAINGITGVRDMGGAAGSTNNGCESIRHETLMTWRKLIQSGSMIGPRLLISGPAVSNTGWPTSINISTQENARNAVRKLKELGVDFIKVYEDIPFEAYQTLAIEAKVSGLSISGHVPAKTVSLVEASNAGQRSIEHIRDPLLMLFTKDREELLDFFKQDHWSDNDIEWGLKQFEQGQKITNAFRKNKTWLVPTLVVESAKVAVGDSLYVNDERRKFLPVSVQRGFADYVTKKLLLPGKDRRSDSLWWAAQKRLVKRMHEEGIQLMAGTDGACEGGIPGYSLHKELQLFVDAGLTALDALQTATINPVRFLEMTDSLGTVEVGKNADLVLLDRNPLEDISATGSVFAVILNGQLISRKRINKIKEGLTRPSTRQK